MTRYFSLIQGFKLWKISGFMSSFALGFLALQSSANSGGLTNIDVTKLIVAAEPSVRDPGGWAKDMLSVLSKHNLPQVGENVCSAIAVIDQESGFAANPAVPGLGEKSLAKVDKKLASFSFMGALLREYLSQNPAPKDNFLKRIRSAKTERDLDFDFRDIIAALAEFGLTDLLAGQFASDLLENQNEIRTIGSMQVSVDFALDLERRRLGRPLSLQEVYRVRDLLYTPKGGMNYGILQLLDYESGYDRKIFRFADYNAGRYASRNAAFQFVLGKLTAVQLAFDGDLLAYDKNGNPASLVSNSENAARLATRLLELGLSDGQIRRDLALEKQKKFTATATYRLVREAFLKRTGNQPPFAMVPNIVLDSVKITRRMTTKDFAVAVTRRFQRCMALTP